MLIGRDGFKMICTLTFLQGLVVFQYGEWGLQYGVFQYGVFQYGVRVYIIMDILVTVINLKNSKKISTLLLTLSFCYATTILTGELEVPVVIFAKSTYFEGEKWAPIEWAYA